jgi:uncharacterized protein
MEIRRFKDIIAVKDDDILGQNDSIVAFHAANMEVAILDKDVFLEMKPVTLTSGEVPTYQDSEGLSEPMQALQSWSDEQNQNVKEGKIEFGIQSITLNINQICNLKCSYCAAGGDGTYGESVRKISIEKTLPQLKFLLKGVKKGETFAISFVGGEPLLHPSEIFEVYKYIESESKILDISPKFKIVTNGTLLNETTVSVLRQMEVHLTVSIDGKKEVNDIIRPSKDGSSTTEKILAGLRLLASERGKIKSINFSSITVKGNCEIFENYLFLKTLNPDSMEFVFANDEKDLVTLQSHISGMKKIMAHAWSNGGEKELRKLKSVNYYFSMLDSQQRTENFCGAGKNYLMVDSLNRFYSCVWDANYKNESVGAGDYLDKEKLAKLSKPLIELNNCNSCWARYLCGGGCMSINRSHTGNKHQKSIIFCERTRSLISTTLMYYKLSRNADV